MPQPRRPRLALCALESRHAPSAAIPLSATTWTEVGPSPIVNSLEPAGPVSAGRVTSVAPHPTNPNIVYVGTAGGGVWRTTNADAASPSWVPLTDHEASLYIGAVAVAPSDPNVVYAGTGEATNTFISYGGQGLLKSTDGGSNWALVGAVPFAGRSVSRVAVDPTDPDTLYVATSWGANGVGTGFGVWKSTDGGASWANTTAGITTTQNFSDVAVNRQNPQTVWCAVGSPAGSARNGVYKSDDGGATWVLQADIPHGAAAGRISLGVAPSNSLAVYATFSSPSTGGLLAVWRTTPGGWQNRTPSIDYMNFLGDYDQAVTVSPFTPTVVYVGGGAKTASTNAILQSTDSGVTWTPVSREGDVTNRPHRFQQALAFDAGGKLLTGTDGGVWRLDNATVGQLDWADKNGRGATGLSAVQFNGIALDPTTPDVAYGGTQGGFGRFTGGREWVTADAFEGFDAGEVVVDPTNPSTVYRIAPNFSSFGLDPGTYVRKSVDRGATWVAITTGIVNPSGSNYYPPLVMDPGNPSRLMTGSNAVSVTTDGGATWAQLGTFTFPGAIDDVAIAKTAGATVYASTYGRIWATTNNGLSWVERSIAGAGWGNFNLEVDPTDARVVYAVRNAYTGGGKQVFRSADGGATWADISGDLPDLPVWALKFIDRGPGPADDLLVIGTERGVYRSTDFGTTWTPFAAGLPNVQVRDLEYAPAIGPGGLLAAGTNGRGMWEIQLGTPAAGVPDAYAPVEDTPFTTPLGVLRNDVDADGHPITADLVTGPAHGTLALHRDGTFTYAPAPDFNGRDTFTYRPNDGLGGSAPVTVTLSVRPTNDAPVAAADAAATPAGKAVLVNVLANDTDLDGDALRVGTVSAPGHGRVTRVGSGLRYTPNAGYQGSDSFTYTVIDGRGGSDAGVVNLTVTDTTRPTLQAVRLGYGTAAQDLKTVSRAVLPWSGVRRFEFVFSEAVSVGPAALTLAGPTGSLPLTLAASADGRVVVGTIAGPGLAAGVYTLRLSGNGVADLNANPLAQGHARTFGVLPGDFDGNGLVDNRDLAAIKKKFQSNPAKVDRFADVNGDGVVDVLDYDPARGALGTRLT